MKTLRLLITTECNLSCEYCCNKLPEVNSKFVTKSLDEIDFKQYEAVCITGGEPLLKPILIQKIINNISIRVPIYLYTNGILLKSVSAIFQEFNFLNGINIGIHSKEQAFAVLNSLKLNIPNTDKIRFYVQDIYKEEYLPNIPDKYIQTWTLNKCFNNIETEDWILLKD